MDDERILGGPTFDLEEPSHRRRIQRMNAETIDRLSWKCDEPATAKTLRRTRDGCGARIEKLRH